MKKQFIMILAVLFLLIVMLASTSCTSTGNIPIEHGMSPISAGYPTAEFSYGDQIFLGLGQAEILEGNLLDDVELYVQGYREGTIKVDSERCNIHWSTAYQNSQKIRVPLTGMARESCIIDVGVFPNYFSPGEQGDLITEGMSGSFLLKVSKPDGPPQLLLSQKVIAGTDAFTDIRLEDSIIDEVQTMFAGCGKEGAVKPMKVVKSTVSLSAYEIVGPLTKIQTCILEGGIKAKGIQKRLSWQLAVYKADFHPLSIPNMQMFGKQARIVADPETALILVNDVSFWGQKAKFNVDPNKKYVIRSISLKGRVALCILSGGGKIWTCQQ
jgi:hypothetical protein